MEALSPEDDDANHDGDQDKPKILRLEYLGSRGLCSRRDTENIPTANLAHWARKTKPREGQMLYAPEPVLLPVRFCSAVFAALAMRPVYCGDCGLPTAALSSPSPQKTLDARSAAFSSRSWRALHAGQIIAPLPQPVFSS
jgi:hypothetical protein